MYCGILRMRFWWLLFLLLHKVLFFTTAFVQTAFSRFLYFFYFFPFVVAIIDDVDLVVLDFSMESIDVAVGVGRDARLNLNTNPAASIKSIMEKPLEGKKA